MSDSPKRLVREVNRKLSKTNQAVFRTKYHLESSPNAYTLLNTLTRELRYLSFEELLVLAQNLGVETL
jgi:hypothetical protein